MCTINFNSQDSLLDSVEVEILDGKQDKKAPASCWEKARPQLVDLLESAVGKAMTVHNCHLHQDSGSCNAIDSSDMHFTASVDSFIKALEECSSPK